MSDFTNAEDNFGVLEDSYDCSIHHFGDIIEHRFCLQTDMASIHTAFNVYFGQEDLRVSNILP